MDSLERLATLKKTGEESFHIGGIALPQNLMAFWRWSSSELVGNALRGMLAEYIVALDLDCSDGIRREWDAVDIKTPDGIRVEVKSAAYIQSWGQKKLSPIRFEIQPTRGWDSETNMVTDNKIRQSDVYVFCVLAHQNKETIDPLDLSQWEFHILPTRTLNEKFGEQKTIILSSLLRLNPIKAEFGKIGKAIREVLKS